MLKNRVRDILVPLTEYPNIRDTASLRDAFSVLQDAFAKGRRYRHILVLDDSGHLVGLLGIRDILHGIFPDYLRSDEHRHFEGPHPEFPALTVIWQETYAATCKEAASNRVKSFMDKVRATIKQDAPLTLAAYLMVINDISMLPVVDDSRVVGVIRMVDVFNNAAEVILHD